MAADLGGFDGFVKLSETFGYTYSHEKARSLIQEYQVKTGAKFSKYKSIGGFGSLDIGNGAHKVQWNHLQSHKSEKVVVDGIPFLILGSSVYDCEYGRDRCASSKRKFREKTDLIEGYKRRRPKQCKKLGCPAQIAIREVVKFPEYQLTPDIDTKKRRSCRSVKLRDALKAGNVTGEKRFYIELPHPSEHMEHPCLQNFGDSNMGDSMDIPLPSNEIIILQEGYAFTDEQGRYRASCTITLINNHEAKIIVDTGNPWDKKKLLQELASNGTDPSDINFVVCTHGHSDHVGNMNLFTEAVFLVGSDISCKPDIFLDDSFQDGKIYHIIPGQIEVFTTPGHTHNDVSVLVRNTEHGTVVVAGDVFECKDDDAIWESSSFLPEKQRESRSKVLSLADYIIPGHGPPFTVNNGSAQ